MEIVIATIFLKNLWINTTRGTPYGDNYPQSRFYPQINRGISTLDLHLKKVTYRYTSLSFAEFIPHIGVTCLLNFTFPHFHSPYYCCYLIKHIKRESKLNK